MDDPTSPRPNISVFVGKCGENEIDQHLLHFVLEGLFLHKGVGDGAYDVEHAVQLARPTTRLQLVHAEIDSRLQNLLAFRTRSVEHLKDPIKKYRVSIRTVFEIKDFKCKCIIFFPFWSL